MTPAQRLRAWMPWVLLVPVLVAGLAIATFGGRGAQTSADRVQALASQFKCPTCRSESVANSNAPTAQFIKNDIAKRVESGQSDDEIRAAIIARYGTDLLLTPPATGVSSLVWVLPVIALVLALAGLAVAFRRWRATSDDGVTEEDRALVAAALAAEHDAAPAPR